MIEIKLQEEAGIREACLAHHIPCTSRTFVYRAADSDGPMGIVAFEIDGETGRILLIHMEREGLSPIADGLLRSALSLMVTRGVKHAFCSGGVDPKLLFGAGFQRAGEEFSAELSESFFAGC